MHIRPNLAAQDEAYAVFEALDTLDPQALGADMSGPIPALRFSPDAQELFNAWRDELEHRLRADELKNKPAFEAHLSKYRSLMPSLALLFHLVDVLGGKPSGPVSLGAAQLAAGWCAFLEQHALKLYAPEVSAHVRAALALAGKIEEGALQHGTAVRDIYRRGWEGLKAQQEVMQGFEVLAEYHWARTEEKSTGGRPSLIVHLHPELREGEK